MCYRVRTRSELYVVLIEWIPLIINTERVQAHLVLTHGHERPRARSLAYMYSLTQSLRACKCLPGRTSGPSCEYVTRAGTDVSQSIGGCM